MHWLTFSSISCMIAVALHASIANANDDDMFEFVRSHLDSTSSIVRKGITPRARKTGKKQKIPSTGPNNHFLDVQMQVGKGRYHCTRN